MRLSALIVIAFCLVLSIAMPARAEEAALSSTAPAASARSPLIRAVVGQLRARSYAKPAPQGEIRDWLWELAGYYGAPDATSHWVDEAGLTEAGSDLTIELRRAAEWGLDAARFDIPDPLKPGSTIEELATTEVRLSIAAITYAFHARGGRVNPKKLSLWLDQQPRVTYVYEVLKRITTAADPTEGLRSLHPQHLGFERLRQAYLVARGFTAAAAVTPRIPFDGPRLIRRMRHPDVAIVRDLLNVKAKPGEEDFADADLMDAVHDFMYDRGYRKKFVIDADTRRELNSRGISLRGLSKQEILNKYIVNLERWRWLPEEMGQLYVWNNLPEYLTRVVKDGRTIHEERIIIGKPETQTPVFSDEMSHVIFNPEWGMPESIKIRQLLGSLRGGDADILSRRGLKVVGPSGKEISARKINWSKTNIRDVAIVQRAGPGNPLGRLKFIFPNAHDVYMHDTPDKYLFDSSERTFSHGCMRLRNPARYAEVILNEAKGWKTSDVQRQLGDKATVKVDLDHHIPVHVTYFSMLVDEEGNVSSFKDVYEHDRRILDALTGRRTIEEIAASDPARAQKKANEELVRSGGRTAEAAPRRRTPRRIDVASNPYIASAKPFPPPSYLKKAPRQPKGFYMFFQ